MNLFAVGTIFSSIVQAIHAAESFFKDSPGKTKFDRVLQIAHDTIDDAVHAFPGIVTDAEALKAAAGPFINAVVATLNAQGVFAKGKGFIQAAQASYAAIAPAKKLANDVQGLIEKIRSDFPVKPGDGESLNAHTAALADAVNSGQIGVDAYSNAVNDAHKAYADKTPGSVDAGGA